MLEATSPSVAVAHAASRALAAQGAPSQSPAQARPYRVLVTSYRSHPQVGGQGVYVRELARGLLDLGHKVTVASGPPYPELPEGAQLARLPSLDLFAEPNALLAFRPEFLRSGPDLAEWWLHNTGTFGEPYAFGERLRGWLAERRDHYDVVHDNQGLFSGLPKLYKPTIATLHHPITVDLDFALAAEPSWAMRALIRRWHSFLATQARVARGLRAIVTVSEASKARAITDFGLDPARIRVSPNGVDHDMFHERRNVARDPDLVLSAVSADTPIKGLVVLVEAMARVVAARPDAKLQIVGDLRDGPAKRAIARHGLAPNVIFSGRKSQAELAELYARAATVVAPSLFEGFGLPAAEAMACGAALVVTDGGALPEVVGDAGLIAPAGDAEALSRSILAVLGDKRMRRDLGKRGAARARERFSWRAHAEAAVDAYRDAGARAHG